MVRKFDLAIMNPPYSGNLHLKILEKVIPMAEETINISPIRWLQDPLAKYKKNSDYNKFKESVAEHIDKLDLLDANKSSLLFNAQLGDCAIIKCNNSKGRYDISNIMGDNRVLLKVLKYVNSNKYNSIKSHVEEKKSKYFCQVLECYGGNPYTGSGIIKDVNYIPRKASTAKNSDKQILGVNFDNRNLAENFHKSSRTLFFSYLCIKLREGVRVSYGKKFPWMNDYSEPWTDERFREYFDITDEEWEEIEKTMERYR